MMTNEDKQLKEFFQQQKHGEPYSAEFTESVMRRLPHRTPAPLWNLISLIVVWCSVLVWLYKWRDQLVDSILALSYSLTQMKMPDASATIGYVAFIAILTLASWMTIDTITGTKKMYCNAQMSRH